MPIGSARYEYAGMGEILQPGDASDYRYQYAARFKVNYNVLKPSRYSTKIISFSYKEDYLKGIFGDEYSPLMSGVSTGYIPEYYGYCKFGPTQSMMVQWAAGRVINALMVSVVESCARRYFKYLTTEPPSVIDFNDLG